MNTFATDSAELLRQIEEYELDDSSSEKSFSKRLSDDNGWSLPYAKRVMGEYKRFIFLGIVAGHPVTPSDEIDQAWHLHMIYTRDYWDEFCPHILGQPFHHGPSKGGKREEIKYGNWYQKTIASYEHFFHEPPPSDIWPRGPMAPRTFMRINLNDHVVIKKSDFPIIASLVSCILKLVQNFNSNQKRK